MSSIQPTIYCVHIMNRPTFKINSWYNIFFGITVLFLWSQKNESLLYQHFLKYKFLPNECLYKWIALYIISILLICINMKKLYWKEVDLIRSIWNIDSSHRCWLPFQSHPVVHQAHLSTSCLIPSVRPLQLNKSWHKPYHKLLVMQIS